jgi:hypothetical protein
MIYLLYIKSNRENGMEDNDYTIGVDWEFLKAMGITWVLHQPWQIGLFYPDLKGKFIWYPKKGTLMYQNDDVVLGQVSHRIGESGDFPSTTTEDVYEEIMKKVNV